MAGLDNPYRCRISASLLTFRSGHRQLPRSGPWGGPHWSAKRVEHRARRPASLRPRPVGRSGRRAQPSRSVASLSSCRVPVVGSARSSRGRTRRREGRPRPPTSVRSASCARGRASGNRRRRREPPGRWGERRRRISSKDRHGPEAQPIEDERYLHPVPTEATPEPRRAPGELSISASENDWVGQPGEPYNIKYGVGAYTQFDEIYPTHRRIAAEADAAG